MTFSRIYLIITVSVLLLVSLSACGLLKRQAPPPALQAPIEEVSERAPGPEAYYHYLMATLAELQYDFDKSIAEYKIALQYDPDSAYLLNNLASVSLRKGDLKGAIFYGEEAVRNDPTYVPARVQLGKLYYSMKEPEKAIKQFMQVLKIDPLEEEAYIFLGSLYAESRNFPEAIKILTNLLKFKKDSALGNYYIGMVYAHMGLYLKSEEYLRATIQLDPYFENAIVKLAEVYEIQKKYRQAIELYRKALEINPHNTALRYRL